MQTNMVQYGDGMVQVEDCIGNTDR